MKLMKRLMLLLLVVFPVTALAQFGVDDLDPFHKGRKAVAVAWKDAATALEARPEARDLRAWALSRWYRSEWEANLFTFKNDYVKTIEQKFQAELKAAHAAPPTSETAAAIAACETGLLQIQLDAFFGTRPGNDQESWLTRHQKIAQPHLAALTARGRALADAVRSGQGDVLMVAWSLWERQFNDIVHLSVEMDSNRGHKELAFRRRQIALYEKQVEEWNRFFKLLDSAQPPRAALARLAGRAVQNSIQYDMVEQLRMVGDINDAEAQRQKYAAQGLKLREETLVLLLAGLKDKSLDATACELALQLTRLDAYHSMYRDLSFEQFFAANAEAQKVAAAVAPEGEKADAYTAALARAIRGSLEVEIQRLKFRQKDEAGEDQPE